MISFPKDSIRPRMGANDMFAQLNVLVVDDMPAIRKMLRQMLVHLGVRGRISEAGDGDDAWEKMQIISYDLVICDINMPKMNGLDLLKMVRSSTRYETTPFLMITGEVSEEIVAASAESEVDSYLLKPFQINSLENRLREIIKRKKHPSGGEAIFMQAQRLKNSSRPQQALQLLERLTQPPYKKLAKTLNLMGECYQDLNDTEEAKNHYTQALALNPQYLRAYQNMADLLSATGQRAEALQYLEQAHVLSPMNPGRLFRLGQLCLESGDQDKAQQYLKQCRKGGHKFTNSHCQEAAEVFLQAGLSDVAEELFAQSLKDDPSNLHLFNRLGIALRRQQKHQEALKCYQEALKVDPKSEKIHYNLGILYFDLGEREKSLESFRQALKLRPDFAEAREFLRQHFSTTNSPL